MGGGAVAQPLCRHRASAKLTTDGWVIPLSAELAALKRSNRAAFRMAVKMFPVGDGQLRASNPVEVRNDKGKT